MGEDGSVAPGELGLGRVDVRGGVVEDRIWGVGIYSLGNSRGVESGDCGFVVCRMEGVVG